MPEPTSSFSNFKALAGSKALFITVMVALKLFKIKSVLKANVMKIFAQNRDDKKRVENALEQSGLPAAKTEHLNPSKFTFEDFQNFYRNLTVRQEVDRIFDRLCGGSKKKSNHLTAEQLVQFVNHEQRDPRLNEILYPYVTNPRARDIIMQYEPNKTLAAKGLLSADGFMRYLMSDDNAIVAPEKVDLNADMNQPLSHYFINSSHNTYLTGHQLTGKSSVEMYRQSLLSGCRCIELDCWNGRTSEEEPIITHGYTVVTEISFKEVAEAIADSAFKTSEYPVILSFENHCSAKQQAKMATYCAKLFGDCLLSEPFASHPLAPGIPLPSPNNLLRKIIVKNKKKHYHRGGEDKKLSTASAGAISISGGGSGDKPDAPRLQKTNSKDSGGEPALNGDELILASNGVLKDSDSSSETEDEDEGSCVDDQRDSAEQEQGTASQESEAGAELSALVNYIQPVHFHGFEVSEKRNRSYEISSFVETAATALLKEHPVEFVNYNKRQLSRIYPKGTRVDSSNYMPQVFWNAGCQLVALNFQSMDLALQLNLGIFEYNGRSGYLLKPDFMRRTDRKFDPFAESTVDGIIAGALHVKIISGQFLTDKRVGTYVEVETYGLPADTCRKKFRTKVVPANGINPVYDEEPFELNKVVLPELAVIRVAVYEEGGKLIGHRILPFVGLRPGFRHINLRNESGQPLMLPCIFVHIVVKDYVPDQLSGIADALANPIKYHSEKEKRAQQLSALTDDFDEDQTDRGPQGSPSTKSGGPQTPVKTVVQSNSSFEYSSSPKDGVGMLMMQQASSPGGLKRQDTGGKSGSPRTSVPPASGAKDSSSDPGGAAAEIAEIPIVAETLDKIKKESKIVQNVMTKLEKDLQALQKKHDKAVTREQEIKMQREEKLAQGSQEKKSTLAKTPSRLFKKLSKTNVDVAAQKSQGDEFSEVSVDQASKLQELQRSHSETLISLFRDLHKAELELREKYHEPLHNAYEKAMLASQASQMKELQVLQENEKTELMKRLDTVRADEIKTLKKFPRDKNELARMRREIRQRHIDQAVNEISKLNEIFKKKQKDLEAQHELIRLKLEEEKTKAFDKLQRDYESQCDQVAEECTISKNVLYDIQRILI
uniref:1-phosphatidylinositol 4,5-bisphosphate phosphodiesterase n=1 Tax=Strigamia maritima TaxID=126957 RepID=T1J5Z0_STRMM